MDCSKKIAKAIGAQCPKVADGFRNDGVIINHADVDFSTIAYGADGKTITALTLKDTKKGFKIEQAGTKPFNGTQETLEVGDLMNTIKKDVKIVIFGYDNIDELLGGEFVVVLAGKAAVGEKTPYYVYGIEGGLRASAAQRIPYGDNKGAWEITLTESTAQVAVIRLDAGTTEAANDALYAALTA